MTMITASTRKTFATHPDLTRASRTQVATLLNRRLADAIDLQTQCKQAHWNVKGPNFIALHQRESLMDSFALRDAGDEVLLDRKISGPEVDDSYVVVSAAEEQAQEDLVGPENDLLDGLSALKVGGLCCHSLPRLTGPRT